MDDMENETTMKILLELKESMTGIQKDVEFLKSEMHTNYIHSDENDNAVRELLEEKQSALKVQITNEIELIKKETELHCKQIEAINDRIKTIENAQAQKVLSKWEKAKDYLFTLFLAAIVGALFAWFNIKLPPRPM